MPSVFDHYSILVAGMATSAVVSLGLAVRKAPPGPRGWRRVTPGAMYWTGLALGAGLVLFMSWIWLFVGSSRPDGPEQMRILFWLIIAFGAMTIVCAHAAYQIIRSRIEWRGDRLTFSTVSGKRISCRFGDIREMRSTLLGATYLRLEDGATCRIDPNAAGGMQLIDAIAEAKGVRPHS